MTKFYFIFYSSDNDFSSSALNHLTITENKLETLRKVMVLGWLNFRYFVGICLKGLSISAQNNRS
jgi:hypothetical protein